MGRNLEFRIMGSNPLSIALGSNLCWMSEATLEPFSVPLRFQRRTVWSPIIGSPDSGGLHAMCGTSAIWSLSGGSGHCADSASRERLTQTGNRG
jgi:hypothetical protein